MEPVTNQEFYLAKIAGGGVRGRRAGPDHVQ